MVNIEKTRHNILLFLLIILSSVLFFSCSKIETIESSEFRKLLQRGDINITILDLRDLNEYMNGHLAGAVNIPFNADTFAERVDSLNRGNPLFIYCRKGARTGRAVDILKKSGFKEVYVLQGGIDSWREAGLEIVE